MIKYNPGTSLENIYRFYTDNNVSTDGKKIPLLYTKNGNKKGKIIKLSKTIAKKKAISYYFEHLYKDDKFFINCEVKENGDINVSINSKAIVDISIMENIISETVNKFIIKEISHYLLESGYVFKEFNHIKESNIEIKNITTKSIIEYNHSINLSKIIGCLSSVFNVISDETNNKESKTKEILLKYKRVSNYNEMDAIDSYINKLRKDGMEINAIIEKLTMNFNISKDNALERIAKWASEVNVETGLFENKKITIRSHTGFDVIITKSRSSRVTEITVSGINYVDYLNYLNIYINSLFRFLIYYNNDIIKPYKSICRQEAINDVIIEKDIGEKKATKINITSDDEDDDFLEMFGEEEKKDKDIDLGDDIEFGEDDMDFGDIQMNLDSLGNDEDDDSDDDDEDEDEDDDMDFADVDFDDLSVQSTAKKTPDEKLSLHNEPSKSQLQSSINESKQKDDSDGESKADKYTKKEEDIDDDLLNDPKNIDLEGLEIKGNNNKFMLDKEKAQPKLFLKKSEGKFHSYSRSCPSQYAKQPVILTPEKLKYIDEQDKKLNTKSYDEYITTQEGDKKYHYICPRYWCLADESGKERSLSLEQINKGECGGWDAVIPHTSRTVPQGGRIVEFTDTRFHKKGVDTNNRLVYDPMFPGFLDKSKHPDGLCIPCCYQQPTYALYPESKDGKDKKWKLDIKTKKYTLLDDPNKTKPKSPSELSKKLDYMYEPEGTGVNIKANGTWSQI